MIVPNRLRFSRFNLINMKLTLKNNGNSRRQFLILSCHFVIALFLFPGTLFAAQNLGDFNSATPGNNDHPHNFSSNSGATIHDTSGVEDRICVFCHTPHSASSDGPLWNRNDPIGPNGDGTFPLYGRLDEIVIDDIPEAEYNVANYPNGASRLCLSCHDGVTAIGEVINPGTGSLPLGGLGSIVDENPGSNAVIDLSTSHPISFVYDSTVQNAINNAPGKSGYVINDTSVLDSSSRMQCTACHDPHLDTREGTYTLPMWRNYVGVDDNTDYEDTCNKCHTGGSGSTIRSNGFGGDHSL